MNRIGVSERPEAMAARTRKGHLVAIAADTNPSHVQPRAINRDEVVDLALEAHVEKMLHAAQIAKALFADIRHKRDRSWRYHLRLIQRADHSNQCGQPAAIIRNSRALGQIARRL